MAGSPLLSLFEKMRQGGLVTRVIGVGRVVFSSRGAGEGGADLVERELLGGAECRARRRGLAGTGRHALFIDAREHLTFEFGVGEAGFAFDGVIFGCFSSARANHGAGDALVLSGLSELGGVWPTLTGQVDRLAGLHLVFGALPRGPILLGVVGTAPGAGGGVFCQPLFDDGICGSGIRRLAEGAFGRVAVLLGDGVEHRGVDRGGFVEVATAAEGVGKAARESGHGGFGATGKVSGEACEALDGVLRLAVEVLVGGTARHDPEAWRGAAALRALLVVAAGVGAGAIDLPAVFDRDLREALGTGDIPGGETPVFGAESKIRLTVRAFELNGVGSGLSHERYLLHGDWDGPGRPRGAQPGDSRTTEKGPARRPIGVAGGGLRLDIGATLHHVRGGLNLIVGQYL